MTILETRGLAKTYGSGETRVEALKGVDLKLEQGEFVAVVGPSGSGKSTLLHLLGGLDRPSAGQVFLEGRDLYTLGETELSILRRRKIGFIFQFYNLIPVLTAEENIALPLLLDGSKAGEGRVEELLGLLGLADRRRHLPGELSGGQQQRVSIGRALAYRPSLVLADEPTGNLDRHTGREVIDLLRLSIKRYHQTLAVITHDPDVASQADRVVSLVDGQVTDLAAGAAPEAV